MRRRIRAGQDLADAFSNTSFWSVLEGYWRNLANRLAPNQTIDDTQEAAIISATTALAKFERNLIAGLKEYQGSAR